MTVSYDFSGQTAVVTGAARGFGSAIAQRLATSGAAVWGWDIAPVDRAGVRMLKVDVTDPKHIAAGLGEVGGETRKIDGFVNKAGYGGPVLPVDQLPVDEWQRIIATNFTSMFLTCRQVVPHMRRVGAGRIVNVASVAAKEGVPGLSAYSAASAGIVAFTKSLGKELAETAIRVN